MLDMVLNIDNGCVVNRTEKKEIREEMYDGVSVRYFAFYGALAYGFTCWRWYWRWVCSLLQHTTQWHRYADIDVDQVAHASIGICKPEFDSTKGKTLIVIASALPERTYPCDCKWLIAAELREFPAQNRPSIRVIYPQLNLNPPTLPAAPLLRLSSNLQVLLATVFLRPSRSPQIPPAIPRLQSSSSLQALLATALTHPSPRSPSPLAIPLLRTSNHSSPVMVLLHPSPSLLTPQVMPRLHPS